MYYRNFVINYTGKDNPSFITEMKYDCLVVNKERVIEDLNTMNVKHNYRFEPGYFDEYKNHLDMWGNFCNIPKNICEKVLNDWNELQKNLS